jgi:hypothetical protein
MHTKIGRLSDDISEFGGRLTHEYPRLVPALQAHLPLNDSMTIHVHQIELAEASASVDDNVERP